MGGRKCGQKKRRLRLISEDHLPGHHLPSKHEVQATRLRLKLSRSDAGALVGKSESWWHARERGKVWMWPEEWVAWRKAAAAYLRRCRARRRVASVNR